VAEEVGAHYGDESLTIVGILTGSIIFLADLIRLIHCPLRVGLVQARSYTGPKTSPGSLVVNTDFFPDVKDRHILLVDDIFDTGHTLLELVSQIDEFKPRSIRTAVLLHKQGRSEVPIQPDHVAFHIPDKFVVGYGLDYNDMYRNLPYVAALEDHELADS